MRPLSYRQRLFVEFYLGESSESAADAARRAGYQRPEKLGPRLVEKSRDSGSQQCPRLIPHSFVISSNLAMTNTRAIGFVRARFKRRSQLRGGSGPALTKSLLR